jgi:DnaK suppressor protein
LLGSERRSSDREVTSAQVRSLCRTTGGIVKTMEKAQIQQYRWKLESRREDAVRLLGRLASETRALDVDSPQDTGDQSIGSVAKESLFQQTSQRRRLVLMIEGALRRIADGTYGKCVACARDIPRTRLEALPWTDCCLRCQEIAERELESEPSLQAPGAAMPWKRAG